MMQYTKNFSFLIKENGQPQLTSEQFRHMMNIIYLEGVVCGLRKVKEANKSTDQLILLKKKKGCLFKN